MPTTAVLAAVVAVAVVVVDLQSRQAFEFATSELQWFTL
jgi:hypothetical protein